MNKTTRLEERSRQLRKDLKLIKELYLKQQGMAPAYLRFHIGLHPEWHNLQHRLPANTLVVACWYKGHPDSVLFSTAYNDWKSYRLQELAYKSVADILKDLEFPEHLYLLVDDNEKSLLLPFEHANPPYMWMVILFTLVIIVLGTISARWFTAWKTELEAWDMIKRKSQEFESIRDDVIQDSSELKERVGRRLAEAEERFGGFRFADTRISKEEWLQFNDKCHWNKTLDDWARCKPED